MVELIPNWHPAWVHFPIAFATAAVFFAVTGKLFKSRSWAMPCLIMGRWMLWGAVIFACVATLFGWLAYNSVEHDEAGHLAMTTHRSWALAALGVLVLLAALDMRSRRPVVMPSYGFLALLVAAWLLVMSAAWHGGEVVYRHGIGVMALPDIHDEQDAAPHDAGGHEHDHTH